MSLVLCLKHETYFSTKCDFIDYTNLTFKRFLNYSVK